MVPACPERADHGLVRTYAVAAALAMLLLVGCDATADVAPPTSPAASSATGEEAAGPTWTLAAPSPLSPRWGAITSWIGDRLVVVGGFPNIPCPGELYCDQSREVRNGASYDPGSDTWATTARSPVPLSSGAHTVIDHYLVVSSRRGVIAYDALRDRWLPIRRLFPDFRVGQSRWLSSVGDRLYSTWDGGSFQLTENVQECDLSSLRCRQLPMSRVLASASLHSTALGPVWIGSTGGLLADGDDRVNLWGGTSWTRSKVPSGVDAYAAFATWVVARRDDASAHLAGAVDLRTGRWHPLQRRRAARSWQPNGDGSGWHTYDGWLIGSDLTATRLGRPHGETARHDMEATFGNHQLFLFGGVEGRLSGPPRWRPTGPQALTNELWIRRLPA